jgi:hypothetical protein
VALHRRRRDAEASGDHPIAVARDEEAGHLGLARREAGFEPIIFALRAFGFLGPAREREDECGAPSGRQEGEGVREALEAQGLGNEEEIVQDGEGRDDEAGDEDGAQ